MAGDSQFIQGGHFDRDLRWQEHWPSVP